MFRDTRRIRIACLTLFTIGCLVWMRYNPTARAMIVDFIAPFLIKTKEIELRFGKPALPKTKIELIKENEFLNEEISRLKARLQELRVLRQENTELRKLLKISKRHSFDYITARRINKDPANGGRRVRIDRGAAHGVRVGQPVLANGYLYGRVLEISDQTALVLTIIDPNCKISVRLSGTNIHGILAGRQGARWKVNPLCTVNYLPRDFTYKAGMKVETSAYGTVIPPKIPVGQLVRDEFDQVAKAIDNLYKVANLKPLNLIQETNFVLIVTKGHD